MEIERSREYAKAAEAAGSPVTLIETQGDHRALIDPTTASWHAAAQWLGRG